MDDIANTLRSLEYGGSKADRASRDSERFCGHIRGDERLEYV